jgi:hypothetical protein
MIIHKNRITIILEEDEINEFNNVIEFALDLDAKEHSMTESERKLAKKLDEISNEFYD